VYQEGIAADHFCRRADGPYLVGSVWPGVCHFPDYTNPKTRAWWKSLFPELIESGVAGVWNDMNEPAVFETGTFPSDVRHDYDGHPCSHRKAHNVYGMQMARATYEGVKAAVYPKRPFTITRSLYSGGQRYASVWTGDNIATWEHMWLANIQCQRLSISGVSFTGSDIGGFIDQPTPELFARWMALAVFHPFMRAHSSGDHGEQEPWSFGAITTDFVRLFIELRYQLLPNLYTAFWQYATRGTPMLRPLVYLDQDDPETYQRMAEFGVGDHLLVCPITQADAEGRWLYLPRGQWYYWYTDELKEGKQEIWADAGLDRVPLFVRAGAVVPTWPVRQHTADGPPTEDVTLHIYWKKGSETTELYEDAGEGYAYQETGESCLKTLHVHGTDTAFTVTQTLTGAYRAPNATVRVVLHGLPFAPLAMLVDGKTIEIDPQTPGEAEVPATFGELRVGG
jgi:alpha-glucosidase